MAEEQIVSNWHPSGNVAAEVNPVRKWLIEYSAQIGWLKRKHQKDPTSIDQMCDANRDHIRSAEFDRNCRETLDAIMKFVNTRMAGSSPQQQLMIVRWAERVAGSGARMSAVTTVARCLHYLDPAMPGADYIRRGLVDVIGREVQSMKDGE